MKFINYKKKYRNKNILIIFLVLLNLFLQSYIFFFVWSNFYNVLLRYPYIMKGNIFVSLVYGVLLFIFQIALESNNLKNLRFPMIFLSQCISLVIANILIYLLVILPTYALGLVKFSPIIYMMLVQVVLVLVWSFFSIKILSKIFPPTPMILISSSDNIDILFSKFLIRKDLYNIIDTIDCNLPFNEIKEKCIKFGNVIVGDIKAELRNDIVKFCFDNSINTYVLPKLSDILIKYSNEVYVSDTPFYIANNDGFSIESEIIKRIFDIIFSFIILIVISPLFILVAILIKIEDGGKIFFIQKRITKDNKEFNIFKFRSMKMNKSNEVRPTINDDERITKIGKIIRRTHFDEVPQFINVIIGNMSIVGPRPERKEHVILFSKEIEEFPFRHKVKAGITGFAQIYGKYNTTAYDKLKLDLIYIKSWTLIRDIEIVLKTIKIMFSKENSEGFTKEKSKFINENAKN